MLGTHVSGPAVAPLYLDTTNILPSNKGPRAIQRQTDEDDNSEFDENLNRVNKRGTGQNHENNSSMLLMGMGVVATQNVRDDMHEDEYDSQEDESQYENFGPIIGETPPIVEGGGPSSAVLNTHSNARTT